MKLAIYAKSGVGSIELVSASSLKASGKMSLEFVPYQLIKLWETIEADGMSDTTMSITAFWKYLDELNKRHAEGGIDGYSDKYRLAPKACLKYYFDLKKSEGPKRQRLFSGIHYKLDLANANK
tara:strand:+ start:218 stop:586 length:369 start_codon:yes stop_codon:yes gene_type:complete